MTQDGEHGKTGDGKTGRGNAGQAKGATGRGGGFRRAADRARPALDKVAGRHGFAQADVLLRWAEIVGEALAPTCRPVKVRFGGERKLGATLVVQADGARAPEVEHLVPRILERVNQFYGYRAVSRVRIVQAGWGGFAEPAAAFAGPDRAPSAAEAERAAAMTTGVEDQGLRDALTRLGANVLARRRAGTHPE